MASRRQRNYVIALIALFGLGIYLFFLGKRSITELPDISRRAGEPRADSEFLNIQKAAEYYRYEIRQKPAVTKNYVQLAQLYLQQARISGRHHDYGAKAKQLLDEVVKRDPDDLEALLTRATLLMSQHRFEEALNLAEIVTRRSPYTAPGWGVLSDALKERGDYEGAVKACDMMLSVRPDLRSYARAAHLREIYGDLVGARNAMKMAVDAGVVGFENHAWALYQLGNLYLEEGKLDTAEFAYNGVLQTRPNYPFALSGLARIDCARKDYKQAVQRLLQAYEAAPEHSFMEQLVAVYRLAGESRSADDLVPMVLDVFQQHEEQGWNVNLEFARFCLGQSLRLEEALRRIGQEYERRPDNIEVLETYAWALARSGQAREAMPLLDKAMNVNLRSASLNYRAGMVAYQMGDLEKARDSIQRALSINPHFSATEAKTANETLQILNEEVKFSTADPTREFASRE